MKMNNLINDLSAITQIPKRLLDKLVDNAIHCIGHIIYESMQSKENLAKINIGIGLIYIKFDNSAIQYKFIPSAQLESCLTDVILNKKDILIINVESTLKNKILNTYKEFM